MITGHFDTTTKMERARKYHVELVEEMGCMGKETSLAYFGMLIYMFNCSRTPLIWLYRSNCLQPSSTSSETQRYVLSYTILLSMEPLEVCFPVFLSEILFIEIENRLQK